MKGEALPRPRALIVDDEPLAREGLRDLLLADGRVEVGGLCATGRTAIATILKRPPDLLFLDIQMPGIDGFAVVDAIAKEFRDDELPVIAFVTAYDAHAVRAFGVHALDYVLKPVDDNRLRVTVDRMLARIAERRAAASGRRLLKAVHAARGEIIEPPWQSGKNYLARIAVSSGQRTTLVNVEDVDWIEANSYYAKLHVGPRQHLIRESMNHLERRLDPSRFARIHRSTIVNLDRIAELQPYDRRSWLIVLRDGKKLLMSRGRRRQLGFLFP